MTRRLSRWNANIGGYTPATATFEFTEMPLRLTKISLSLLEHLRCRL